MALGRIGETLDGRDPDQVGAPIQQLADYRLCQFIHDMFPLPAGPYASERAARSDYPK